MKKTTIEISNMTVVIPMIKAVCLHKITDLVDVMQLAATMLSLARDRDKGPIECLYRIRVLTYGDGKPFDFYDTDQETAAKLHRKIREAVEAYYE